jgi:hypothetical protein
MKDVRLQIMVSPEARDAAVRRAILGNGSGQVRLTFGQRRALERLRQRWTQTAVPASDTSS